MCCAAASRCALICGTGPAETDEGFRGKTKLIFRLKNIQASTEHYILYQLRSKHVTSDGMIGTETERQNQRQTRGNIQKRMSEGFPKDPKAEQGQAGSSAHGRGLLRRRKVYWVPAPSRDMNGRLVAGRKWAEGMCVLADHVFGHLMSRYVTLLLTYVFLAVPPHLLPHCLRCFLLQHNRHF